MSDKMVICQAWCFFRHFLEKQLSLKIVLLLQKRLSGGSSAREMAKYLLMTTGKTETTKERFSSGMPQLCQTTVWLCFAEVGKAAVPGWG